MDLFSDESGFVVRTFECLGKNRIKVNVHLEDPAGTPHRQEVGTAILEAKDSTSAFQVVEKNIRAARYAPLLLTASGMEEQAFLRGCEKIDLAAQRTAFSPLPDGVFCPVWRFFHNL